VGADRTWKVDERFVLDAILGNWEPCTRWESGDGPMAEPEFVVGFEAS
jgi:hypothetical protein